jgi:hypothetical protein
MTTGNPWFWGEHVSRWTFERELEKTAVQLRDKNARVVVKKVDIEDVKARKNALAAKGILIADRQPAKQPNFGHIVAGVAGVRKIK